MENYDVISVAGEGSYGIVMKCRNRITKKIVAIKKLLDIESDRYARKMAFREIRILRKLHHENLIKLLEVLRKKKRFYLVFEYLDRTVLDDLEEHPHGLGEKRTREYMYQLIRGIEYCHIKNVIHRDIKPENLLVSKCGILKLCDFGFARVLNASNGIYTEYIATRWYRAPELLVKDRNYGRPVDVWAIGCVFAEMLSGEPLFPGDSDIDQLFQITKRFGKLSFHHQQLLSTLNKQKESEDPGFESQETYTMNNVHALHSIFPSWSTLTLNIVAICLHLDPKKRPTATELLNHEYFHENNFRETFYSLSKLKRKKTPRKSSLTIEFDSEFGGSNVSTPRILNSLRKTPSPSGNFVPNVSGSVKSPTILKLNTGRNHPDATVDNHYSGPFFVHKLIPFNAKHIYSDNLPKKLDFPKTPPFNLRWTSEYAPNSKFQSSFQETGCLKNDTEGEGNKELPSTEVPRVKEKVQCTNQQNNKILKPMKKELNLPYLNHVIGAPKTKQKINELCVNALNE